MEKETRLGYKAEASDLNTWPAPSQYGQAYIHAPLSVREGIKLSTISAMPPQAPSQRIEELPPCIEEYFVKSTIFEVGVGIMICASCACLALEVDNVLDNSFQQFLENVVTSFFLAEWLIRFKAHGYAWFKLWSTWLDTFVVWIPGVLAVWFLQPIFTDGSVEILKMIRIIRMLRLLRLVQVLNHFYGFQDMWALVRGLLGSAGTLFAAVGLIVACLYMFAIIGVDLIGNQVIEGADAEFLIVQFNFSTVLRSMLTLVRFMHGDDCQTTLDILSRHLPHIWMYLYLVTAVTSYALLNLVTAVIVQQAFETHASDEEELAMQFKMQRDAELLELRKMFESLDEDNSGQVTLEEFMQAFKIPAIKTKLILLGMKEKDLLELFRLLDVNREGQLSLEEFMEGMSQLNGEAKSKDMVMLQKNIERVENHLFRLDSLSGPALQKLVDKDDSKQHAAPDPETCSMLRQRLRKVRAKIDKRLTQAELEVNELADILSRVSTEFMAFSWALSPETIAAEIKAFEPLPATPASSPTPSPSGAHSTPKRKKVLRVKGKNHKDAASDVNRDAGSPVLQPPPPAVSGSSYTDLVSPSGFFTFSVTDVDRRPEGATASTAAPEGPATPEGDGTANDSQTPSAPEVASEANSPGWQAEPPRRLSEGVLSQESLATVELVLPQRPHEKVISRDSAATVEVVPLQSQPESMNSRASAATEENTDAGESGGEQAPVEEMLATNGRTAGRSVRLSHALSDLEETY
eukprot:TRINITY_DN28522_c0_g1_i1.p1 TRINITY_DN28522_c0_g1~~TRINITY_DN28522_c0_g1_i1.p1  ORF type:complete len:772 (-),score=179.21 TRINITY_DN28522_c0_g1_i1:9-2249(-)